MNAIQTMTARAVLVLTMLGLLAGCGEPVPQIEPEGRLLTGPTFWTGDPERPTAAGLLVKDGKIVRVLDAEGSKKLIAVGQAIERVPGELAVPGLVDAHAHILGYGMSRRYADLVGTTTLQQTRERIASFAKEHPDDSWVLGRGWDQNDWPGAAWPDADQLQQTVPDRPAALRRVDGHAMWVNRAALAAAGIDAKTADPPGGSIHRDRNGRPTGILIDAAMNLVNEVIPAPSDEMVRDALRIAARDLTAVGLTGVHDMGIDKRTWQAMKQLAEDGEFPLRVTAYAAYQSDLHRELLATGPQRQGRLQLVGVKLYADGALGSRGARLIEPYSDAPGELGLWQTPIDELESATVELIEAGLQPAIHAIGDAANRLVLDIFERSGKAREVRARVEHVQIVHPDDLPRFAELGAIPSMQPTHATSDMPWAETRVGAERIEGGYAWRTLSDSGAVLALGSDFPVESIDPRLGLYSSVARQDLDGQPEGGWQADQTLTLEQALTGFAYGAAFAANQDDELGRLVVGAACDLTVFGEDLFAREPIAWTRTPIASVIIGGDLVHP